MYDFVNVIHEECTLKQALIKDKRFETLFVLAASQTRDKDALSKEGVEKVLKDLTEDGFDYIICDSPAGIEKGASLAMSGSAMTAACSAPTTAATTGSASTATFS